ncbi:MAG: DNA methyltransferase [Hydrotalea sp.]|nr:DNA methyltransferase [Hydrotalea sp.]
MQKTLKNRTIFCRDNIEVLRGIDSNSIDLIYLDPPFNKKRHFHAPIGGQAEGASFKDTWYEEDTKEEWVGLIADEQPVLHDFLNGIEKVGDKSNKYYLVYMAIRLLEIKRILKETGSVYLHCDTTMSHFLKLLMDCIFDDKNFRNEIVWCYTGGGRSQKDFANKHDIILRYSKSNNYVFNDDDVRIPYNLDITKRTSPKAWGSHGSDKIYAPNEKGKIPEDWWEISPINSQSKERVGYPTQKPTALLERIIKASSNKGGLILDPFCGCATTMVAAEKLDRQWIGIDVSSKAFDLVKIRLNKEVADKSDLLKRANELIFREDIPERTDTIKNPTKKVEIKHILYGRQKGRCVACDILFDFRHLTLDHIVPRKKGGGDGQENLQLLCGSCNSMKSDNDMPTLMKKLRALDIVK